MRPTLGSAFAGAVLVLVLVGCPSSREGVVSVAIDGGDRTLAVGGARELTATVVTTGGASGAVTWRSSDEAVVTIDAAGTALGISVGPADITATSVFDVTKSDTVKLTVEPPGVLRWTRQFGTSGGDFAEGIATDANENVFVAGYTNGALDGAHAGSTDAFVRAYDRSGVLRWARQFGTSSSDAANGVATDASGRVYVAGITEGALEGANAGGLDAFVRAYDGDGSLRWTRQFGTSGDDFAFGVATDPTGNAYVAGYTWGALEGANAGTRDAFVRAYDGNGTLRWTRQFGTSGGDGAYAVATDAGGNLYVVGQTEGALEGGSAGGSDAFVRAYASDGVLLWTRQFGTANSDVAAGVAVDTNDDVYIAGHTTGPLEGANAGIRDAFVRTYDGNGDLRWTRQFGTSGEDTANGVATGANGFVYLTGSTIGDLEGVGAGGSDAFVRAYASDGGLRWTRQFGTSGVDTANGIATDGSGDVYAAGRTTGALEGASVGGNDVFVRAYGP